MAVRALSRLPEHGNLHAVFLGADRTRYPDYASIVDKALGAFHGKVTVADGVGVDQIPRFYQGADITLIPSFLEATSLAALEAMACGSIVIASAVGGMPEIIRDGETGFLVPPGDVDALCVTIQRACGLTEASRNEMRGRARQLVEHSYSWTNIARRVMRLYIEAPA